MVLFLGRPSIDLPIGYCAVFGYPSTKWKGCLLRTRTRFEIWGRDVDGKLWSTGAVENGHYSLTDVDGWGMIPNRGHYPMIAVCDARGRYAQFRAKTWPRF